LSDWSEAPLDLAHGLALLPRLLAAASDARSAVMCAERLPEQCQRQILADASSMRGARVVHVLGAQETRPHRLHAAARPAVDGGVEYPAPQPRQLAPFAAE